jgi:hypothetical protein
VFGRHQAGVVIAEAALLALLAAGEALSIEVRIAEFTGQRMWFAVVEGGTLDMVCEGASRRRPLTSSELAQLRDTTVSNDVISLAGVYGSQVIDGLQRTVDLRIGDQRAKFSLGHLERKGAAGNQLEAGRRGLRLYVAVRMLEPECYPSVDRERDERVLRKE